MSINKNFQVKNGLSINGLEVIDGDSNANLNSALIAGVDILAYTQAAFNQANTGGGGGDGTDQYARNTANSASSNTVIIQGVDVTQNTRINSIETINTDQNTAISIIQGVDATQNTNITHVNEYAAGAYATANTNATNISIIEGVNAWQNNEITHVNEFAAGAYAAANSKFSSSGGTITGSVTITNDLTVNGNVSFVGNVTSIQVTGNSGQFFGYTSNGFNALYAGIPLGYLIEPQTVFNISSDYDGYAAMNMQNINSGANSSSDYFITADNGSIVDGFLDLGLAGSNYNYPGYSLLTPNDGYLFVSGNTTTGGGDLIVGTQFENDVIFAAGGLNTENEVMRITSANNVIIKSTNPSTSNTTGALTVAGGVGVAGNVYADAVYSNEIPVITNLFIDTSTPFINFQLTNVDGGNRTIQMNYGNTGTGNLVFSEAPTLSSLAVSNTTPSTSTTTGALKVSGGLGVAGNVYADFANFSIAKTGGSGISGSGYYRVLNEASIYTINTDYNSYSNYMSPASGPSAITLSVYGDPLDRIYTSTYNGIVINFSNTFITPGTMSVSNTTPSTSNTTGALTITGGLGVAGNVYGTTIYTDSLRYAANGQPWVMGSSGAGVSATGWLANSLIIASQSGTLSNTSNLQYFSSNNTLDVTGNIMISSPTTSNSVTMLYNAANNSLDFIFN